MMIFLVILAYLMGSIPSGYLLVKYKFGDDIRNFGSGNIGATNVERHCGKKVGNIIKLCDISKGLIPVILSDILLKTNVINYDRDLLLTLVAVATIIGHNYTIFLKFKGGKGVATTVGAFIYILPIPMLFTALCFFGLKLITKIVSVRSMSSALVLFLITLLLGYNISYVYGTLFAFLLMVVRHKANIKRLINGEEK